VLFLYHKEAGAASLHIEGDAYRYLFKVRRRRVGEDVPVRNLQDSRLYIYRIKSVDRRRALLVLESEREEPRVAKRYLHLGWCIVDPKTVEKTLPMLNEMGVARISFIYCERSQRSFRLDFERLKKILINSSQQCGRSDMMQLETVENLAEFLKRYPHAYMMDFSSRKLSMQVNEAVVLIGCEGGWTQQERALMTQDRIFGLDTPLVLRSESAAVSVAAKILI